MDNHTFHAIYEACYREGLAAFRAGVPLGGGPYSFIHWPEPIDDETELRSEAWNDGWLEAEAIKQELKAYEDGLRAGFGRLPVPCPYDDASEGRLAEKWRKGWVSGVFLDAHDYPEIH